jgi:hypothetical protein
LVDKPYESPYGLLTFATTLLRAVFIRTKYECKVIDLDKTSIAAAIGDHGGLLRIDYCRNAQRLLEVAVSAPADVCDA